MLQTVSIVVKGKVHGVHYRQSVREKCTALGITGSVRNLADGTVQIAATGTKAQIDDLLRWCKEGPPRAVVTAVEWKEELLVIFEEFRVIR